MSEKNCRFFVAENVAKKYGLTRLEQDTFAFESQSKTKVALDEGHFTHEIVPVSVAGRRGPPTMVNAILPTYLETNILQ